MVKSEFRIGKYGFTVTEGWITFHDLKADSEWTEPPYEQAIFWIMSTRAGIEDLAVSPDTIARLTSSSWADLGVKSRLLADGDHAYCRHVDHNNSYYVLLEADNSTADHQIYKRVNGSDTVLATESVDLSKYWYWILFEIEGTELRSYRAPDPYSDVPTSPTLTATDTDIAQGRFGVRHWGHGWAGLTGLFFFLKEPRSEAKKPIKYFLIPIEGDGNEDNPFRPKLPIKLKEVNKVQILDKKRFEKLKKFMINRGLKLSDVFELGEALGLVFIDRYENVYACTWSALIPTRRGKPIDYECIVRIFDVKTEKVFDEIKELGGKEISRDEALKLAKKKDDKLHDMDLIYVKDKDEAKKKAKEYIEWRKTIFNVETVSYTHLTLPTKA